MYDFKECLACGNEQTGLFQEDFFYFLFFFPPPCSCCLASQKASGVALLEDDNLVCGQGSGTALAPASLRDASLRAATNALSNPPNSDFQGSYGRLGAFQQRYRPIPGSPGDQRSHGGMLAQRGADGPVSPLRSARVPGAPRRLRVWSRRSAERGDRASGF